MNRLLLHILFVHRHSHGDDNKQKNNNNSYIEIGQNLSFQGTLVPLCHRFKVTFLFYGRETAGGDIVGIGVLV